MKTEIDFLEFLEIEKKLEIKWGRIMKIERIPKSKKLLKLEVSFGEEKRVVVTNIGDQIENEQLLQWQHFPFITNLKPTVIMGVESTAMIMPSTNTEGKIVLCKDNLMGQIWPPAGSILL